MIVKQCCREIDDIDDLIYETSGQKAKEHKELLKVPPTLYNYTYTNKYINIINHFHHMLPSHTYHTHTHAHQDGRQAQREYSGREAGEVDG
jgi:hypothetical protein